MKTAFVVYLGMGVLAIVPLLLFNIKKIWVRNTPDVIAAGGKMHRLNIIRCCVIFLIGCVIAAFLVSGYRQTLSNRFEMAVERLASEHAKTLMGQTSTADFRNFVLKNGTDKVAASFDAMKSSVSGSPAKLQKIRFQISEECRPRYWKGKDGFAQVETVNDDNPIYVMYRLDINGQYQYIAARFIQVANKGAGDSVWKYDWIGNASEEEINVISMPTPDNGKWFTVE